MKILVAGWFSFKQGHATAGDLLARDLVCDWLREAGREFDVAVDPPFTDGINWRKTSPSDYSHIVFVCGPFQDGELEQALRQHFRDVPLIGMNLSMVLPLEEYNPFLNERLFYLVSSAIYAFGNLQREHQWRGLAT